MLCLYFEKLRSVALAILQYHFRVAEISFFALHYKSTTNPMSHGKLFDVPRFDNIGCDGAIFWQKPHMKKRDPNKLETRNILGADRIC